MRDANATRQREQRNRLQRAAKRAVLAACLVATASPAAATEPNRPGGSPVRIVSQAKTQTSQTGVVRTNPFVQSARQKAQRWPVQLASGNKTSITLKNSDQQIGLQPIGGTANPAPRHNPNAMVTPPKPVLMPPSEQIAQPMPRSSASTPLEAPVLSKPNSGPLVISSTPLIASEGYDASNLIGDASNVAPGRIELGSRPEASNPPEASYESEAPNAFARQGREPKATASLEMPIPSPPAISIAPAISTPPAVSTDAIGPISPQPTRELPRLTPLSESDVHLETPELLPMDHAQTVVPVTDARDSRAPIQETQPIFFSLSDQSSGESETEPIVADDDSNTQLDDLPLPTEPSVEASDASEETEVSASDLGRPAPLTMAADPIQMAPALNFGAPETELSDSVEPEKASVAKKSITIDQSDAPVESAMTPGESTLGESQPGGLVVETKPIELLDRTTTDPSIAQESAQGVTPIEKPSVLVRPKARIQVNEKVASAQALRLRPPVAVTTPPISVQDAAETSTPKPVIDSIAVDPIYQSRQDETIVYEAPGATFEPFLPSDDGRTLPDLLAENSGAQPATPALKQKSVPAQSASFRKQTVKPVAEIARLNMSRTQVRSLTIGGRLVRVSVADKDVCQVIASGPSQLKLIGTGNGSTRLVVWANTDSDGPTRMKTFEIHVQDTVESSGAALGNKIDLLNKTIARMFPEANVTIAQQRDRLTVSGQCTNDESARQIIRMVRKTCLVPVNDSITVK